MKRIKLIVCLCTISLTMMTGCSGSSADETSADIVETVDKAEDTLTAPESENETKSTESENETESAGSENGEENTDSLAADESKDAEKRFSDITADEIPKAEDMDELISKFNDEISGDVKEINPTEKFVVISRTYIESLDNGVEIMTAPAEGSSEEEIIKVYFVDGAKYLLETGKADGTDVTQREADFSDITVKDNLMLKGLSDTTGTEFLASEIKISRVID